MRALDAATVREWADACVARLDALRGDIDGINVYPVADSDTGSNLLHTVSAARAALAGRAATAGAGEALGVLAGAAVRAARGNSGMIFSQVLRGLADAAGDAAELDGSALAAALCRADTVATGAVARPVAGTMLSVLHAAAAAVRDEASGSGGTLDDVAGAAAKAAAEALAETPKQLAPLAVAGVVDAGGRGLVAVFDALVAVVTGGEVVTSRPLDAAVGPPAPGPGAWEVMYLLTVPSTGPGDPSGAGEPWVSELRRALSALGDSVTVAATGDGDHAVHVHCADIGAALEAGLRHGTPHGVRVEPLVTPAPADSTAVRGDRAVVAVVHGDAVAELVDAEGVPVLTVRADAEPSAEELLGLITNTAAAHVTVLAGGARLTAAAERVGTHPMLADRNVVVVPCASPVQVLAALAVHDPDRRAGADDVAMAEAAAATRRGELVVAEQDAITWRGRAAAGDLVGLIDGEVVLIESGRDPVRAALDVLDTMLAAGGELVTLLVGADAPADLGDTIGERLRAARPEVELVCYPGGQTDALLLMGVE